MTFDDIWRHLMSGRGNVGGSFKNSRYFWHSAWGHTLEHCPVRCIACLPQVVHDANAVSSMYAQCHICRMAVLHDGTHCIRAMQYGVHWTPYCMNAMHLIRQHKGGETMRVKVRSVWKYLIALVFKALERGRSELGGKTKRLHRFTSSLHLNLVWTPFKWISLH